MINTRIASFVHDIKLSVEIDYVNDDAHDIETLKTIVSAHAARFDCTAVIVRVPLRSHPVVKVTGTPEALYAFLEDYAGDPDVAEELMSQADVPTSLGGKTRFSRN